LTSALELAEHGFRACPNEQHESDPQDLHAEQKPMVVNENGRDVIQSSRVKSLQANVKPREHIIIDLFRDGK
jgi:hypothetical protein